MKLLTKTTIAYVAIFLFGLSLAGFVIFDALKREFQHEADEELYLQHDLVASFVGQFEQPDSLTIPGVHLRILTGQEAQTLMEDEYGDTLIAEVDGDETEFAPYRTMRWRQQIGERQYEITIFKALIESEDTLEAIFIGMIPTVLFLTLMMVILVRIFSRILWLPFYASLHEIDLFRPDGKRIPHFPEVSTREFSQLNIGLKAMTDKVLQDYQNLKAFSENASHELQTPLAIAQSKLEHLLQSTSLQGEDMATIATALEAIQRMKRINEALLTLSKIENQQYSELQPLSLKSYLQKQINAFTELAAFKNITMNLRLLADPLPRLNPTMTDLLLSNLMINALRHNRTGGGIEITLDAGSITIANTGSETPLDASRLFLRFQRQDIQTPGAGLGLAISKEICDAMGLKISYEFQENLHSFRIVFQIQD